MKPEQEKYYQELTQLIKPTIVINGDQFEIIKKSKKYKIIKMWVTPLQHKSYEGKRRGKKDYFQGYRVETEKIDMIYLNIN